MRDVVTTFPPHLPLFGAGRAAGDRAAYLAALDAHCGWAERLGATGMLIYHDPGSLEPWTAATTVLARTTYVTPIVAVNARLTHPEATARHIAAVSFLYGRRVDLNLVTGAKTGELEYIGPEPPDKYALVADFAAALIASLAGQGYEGPAFRLPPASGMRKVSPDMSPVLFAPASRSERFGQVAPVLRGCLVMAKPRGVLDTEIGQLSRLGFSGEVAMLVGIVARATADQARRAAQDLHAGTRRDALVTSAFRRVLTSSQHSATFAQADLGAWHDECLWYGAGRAGIDCPKLVGSYNAVAAALAGYRDLGVRRLVLDLPAEPEEYAHIDRCLAEWS